jgi:hypothetical protein
MPDPQDLAGEYRAAEALDFVLNRAPEGAAAPGELAELTQMAAQLYNAYSNPVLGEVGRRRIWEHAVALAERTPLVRNIWNNHRKSAVVGGAAAAVGLSAIGIALYAGHRRRKRDDSLALA